MYMVHKTYVGADARKKMLSGVNKVYDAVRRTLGPAGKNALLPRTMNRGPRNTNDGVTISENVRQLKDPHERLAAEFFGEGAKKTNEVAGDGTTTTTVLAGHLINKVLKDLPENSEAQIGVSKTNVMAIRKEIKDAAALVVEEIKKQAKPVKTLEDLEKIALISIEDEAAAKTVAGMVWELGVDNYIDTTEGFKGEVETEIIRGMRFPAKVAARVFVNKPERHEMLVEDAPVFITNYKIDNAIEIAHIVNNLKVAKLAIIAPDFSDNVLVTFVNGAKNGIFVFPIKVPSLRTVQLEDLAVYTKATLIDKDTGRKLDNVTQNDLGFAERIVVKETENKEDAVLLGGKGEKTKRGEGSLVTERCDMLKKQMEEARNNVEKEQLKMRIANMASAVGIIRVGHKTNAELLYLKLKIEDGVYACKAALEEGYVKGGGLALKEIAETLPENILTETLKEPYDQIQKNAGGIKIGKEVIDPAKVVRLEVEHATSIAAQMITTDIITADVREEESPADGYKAIAKAISHGVYFQAKERGMLRDSEELMERDRANAFAEAMFNDLD